MIKYVEFEGNYTFFLSSGQILGLETDHVNYNWIVDSLNWIDEPLLVTRIREKATALEESNLNLTIKNGKAYFGDVPIPSAFSDKIYRLIQGDKEGVGIVNFLQRIAKNPSEHVFTQLAEFLKFNNIQISPDGTFVGYKAVRPDYKDIYTGKIENIPGAYITMPRNRVNDNPNETCSRGLHVGNYDYVVNTFSQHNSYVMLVEVDPADVVSVPTDYQGGKLRTCRYKVLAILGEKKDVLPALAEGQEGQVRFIFDAGKDRSTQFVKEQGSNFWSVYSGLEDLQRATMQGLVAAILNFESEELYDKIEDWAYSSALYLDDLTEELVIEFLEAQSLEDYKSYLDTVLGLTIKEIYFAD